MTAKYKPGDRVVGTGFFRRGTPGAVVKPSKVTATVRWDGRDENVRVDLDSLRPETAEDVAKREHEQAMRAWREQRPETRVARVTFSRFGSLASESGAEVDHAKTPAEMRDAAHELRALADWFEQRPQEKP